MISPLHTSRFNLLVLDAPYTERYVRCGERTGANHPLLLDVGELLDDVLVKRLYDVKGYAIFQGIGEDVIEGLTPIGSAVGGGGVEHTINEVGVDVRGILVVA